MRKHFNLHLMNFIALLSALIVPTSCKKSSNDLATSVPVVKTWYAINVSQTWATLEASIDANNQSTIVTFEYDTTTSYKQSINGTPDTINGNLYVTESAYVTGLKASTTYHFRATAVNSSGTVYGKDTTFTTAGAGGNKIIFNPDLTYGLVSDNDGNTYKTIQIGTQTWMAENLKTTKYNDGTAIPKVTDVVTWTGLTTPGYCWYTNDSVSYGALYNFYSVIISKLCPTGWHVPSDAEWTTLITYLGGESVAGDKQKETGITHWESPNTGATNESGFTALPGGYRNYDGSFTSIRKDGYWWSSTESSSVDAYYNDLFYDSDIAASDDSDKKDGFSVRCLMDN
jgi:uncharacterized protein (TIGR02145 family)